MDGQYILLTPDTKSLYKSSVEIGKCEVEQHKEALSMVIRQHRVSKRQALPVFTHGTRLDSSFNNTLCSSFDHLEEGSETLRVAQAITKKSTECKHFMIMYIEKMRSNIHLLSYYTDLDKRLVNASVAFSLLTRSELNIIVVDQHITHKMYENFCSHLGEKRAVISELESF